MQEHLSLLTVITDLRIILMFGGMALSMVLMSVAAMVAKKTQDKKRLSRMKGILLVNAFGLILVVYPSILYIAGNTEFLWIVCCINFYIAMIGLGAFQYEKVMHTPISTNRTHRLPFSPLTLKLLTGVTILFLLTGVFGFTILFFSDSFASLSARFIGASLSFTILLILSAEFVKCPNCQTGLFGLHMTKKDKTNKMSCISAAFAMLSKKQTIPCIRCETEFDKQ